MEIKMYTVK